MRTRRLMRCGQISFIPWDGATCMPATLERAPNQNRRRERSVFILRFTSTIASGRSRSSLLFLATRSRSSP